LIIYPFARIKNDIKNLLTADLLFEEIDYVCIKNMTQSYFFKFKTTGKA